MIQSRRCENSRYRGEGVRLINDHASRKDGGEGEGEGWKRGQKRVRLETKGIVWTRDACGHCHVLRNGIRDIADFFLSWNTEKFVSVCMPRNRINLK